MKIDTHLSKHVLQNERWCTSARRHLWLRVSTSATAAIVDQPAGSLLLQRGLQLHSFQQPFSMCQHLESATTGFTPSKSFPVALFP